MTTEACRTSPGSPGLHPTPGPARSSVCRGSSGAPPPESEIPAAARPRCVSMPTGCQRSAAEFSSWPPAHAHKRPEPADRQTGVSIIQTD